MNIQLAVGVIALLLVLFLLMNRRRKDGGETTASPIAGAFSSLRRRPKPDAQPAAMPMVDAVQETAATGSPELTPMAPPPAPAPEPMIHPQTTAPIEPVAPPPAATPATPAAPSASAPPVDEVPTLEPPMASPAEWAIVEENGWPSPGEVEGSWSQGAAAATAPSPAQDNDGYEAPTEPLVGWTPRQSGQSITPPTIEFPATPEPGIAAAPSVAEPMSFEAPQPPVAEPAIEAPPTTPEPMSFEAPQPPVAEPAIEAPPTTPEPMSFEAPQPPVAEPAVVAAPGIEPEASQAEFDHVAGWSPAPSDAPTPGVDVIEPSSPAFDAAAGWSAEAASPEPSPSSHEEIVRAVEGMAPAVELAPTPVEIAEPAPADELPDPPELGGASLWDELGPAPSEVGADDGGSEAVAWWDEQYPPQDTTTDEPTERRFGRFALGGVAFRPGDQAICSVSFSERASVPPQAANIHLAVAGAENCRPEEVTVMAKRGFAPSEEGFTVVASAEVEGPFMVSGTYHVD